MMSCPCQGCKEPHYVFIAGKYFSVTECGGYPFKDQWSCENEEYGRWLDQNTERNIKWHDW